MEHKLKSTGITIAYEPRDQDPVVDIVFVHGLQGHPYRTWACKTSQRPPDASRSTRQNDSEYSKRGKQRLQLVVSRLARKSSQGTESTASLSGGYSQPDSPEGDRNPMLPSVFWPTDLLPQECPKSRIMSYGYDSDVTKFGRGAPNKSNTFSHGKDLMFALSRERIPGRPLIFVAHSLGGIIVKEMLSTSSTAPEPNLSNIVASTAAVIFLGTPHRGSPDLSALAEWARFFVARFPLDSSGAILATLGLRNSDLERAQEAFSRAWQRYDFRVKTFQEGLGLTGIKLGVISNKVVPDYSSLLGDQRERAETLQANHMDMCRYTGSDDPNYRKVSGELRSVYLSITECGSGINSAVGSLQRSDDISPAPLPVVKTKRGIGDNLSDDERAFLQALSFPSMNWHYRDIDPPAEGTGQWLFEDETYKNWFSGENRIQHDGVISIKGKPGSGKSVLMKEAFHRASLLAEELDYCTAAFFFNASGDDLSRSSIGLLRSLLYQLLPRHPDYFKMLYREWSSRSFTSKVGGADELRLHEKELRQAFRSMVCRRSAKRTIIFIDALDECDEDTGRPEAYFWLGVAETASRMRAPLDICVSGRHFPTIELVGCPRILMEHGNRGDIGRYVKRRLEYGISSAERKAILRHMIVRNSDGVFLWVILVVDDILRKWDEGRSMKHLLDHLYKVPKELEGLFRQILSFSSREEEELANRLLQWAILPTKPLRIQEWHHIMAFIRRPAPFSLHQWRSSEYYTEDDGQLEKQIRNVSRGLVEVRTRVDEIAGTDALETVSMRAGAGSLSIGSGQTRIVQVIHESVRGYCRTRSQPQFDYHSQFLFDRTGHLMIMETCLDYLDISELDALVLARFEAHRRRESRRLAGRAPRISSESSGESLSDEAQLPPQGTSGDVGTSVFETLRSSSNATPQRDIHRWLKIAQFSILEPAQNEPPCSSMVPSQILEDYPALLSYATHEFFTHARLAQDNGAVPDPIVERLSRDRVWDRWVALREDVPVGTRLWDYASSQHLGSWRHVMYLRRKDPRFSETLGDRASRPWSPLERMPNRPPSPEYPVKRRRRKIGSVASFSSAGSHTDGSGSVGQGVQVQEQTRHAAPAFRAAPVSRSPKQAEHPGKRPRSSSLPLPG